ncbi:MAG: hypothetical protein HKN51_08545 [Saprospiraceae bacterium]|nr:hypothetical protein [Saprospiraceae bacterium]
MSNAITISGSQYTVTGSVKNKKDNKGIIDLHVIVYDKDLIFDDVLGIANTDKNGNFSLTFEWSKFKNFLDRKPDLYFVVKDAGLELLSTKENVIKEADESTPPINFVVELFNDKLRTLIKDTAVEGWEGGFKDTNDAFAYPNPNFDSLEFKLNRKNIGDFHRMQKVLWPEFSWETQPGASNPERCYQMFAPDISRLGYTKDGQIYSIICPQQGVCSPHLGCMNVEVTVLGSKGWVDETTRELAGDMKVEGQIWFSPSSHNHKFVKIIKNQFEKENLPFPRNKDNAIKVTTHLPGDPTKAAFPLRRGPSKDFPIPEFATHKDIAWSLGHLGVQIGPIVKTGIEKVDKFNQIVMDVFNTASGNMLKEGNILTWNVWFNAPEKIDEDEWTHHTEVWRESIQADHGSPDGEGTVARFFDGSPYQPLKEIIIHDLPKIIAFISKHVEEKHV